MAHLFVELFRDAINEVVYMAELSGMKYVMEQSKYGLTVGPQSLDCLIDHFTDRLN
jgi:hypothetical protein